MFLFSLHRFTCIAESTTRNPIRKMFALPSKSLTHTHKHKNCICFSAFRVFIVHMWVVSWPIVSHRRSVVCVCVCSFFFSNMFHSLAPNQNDHSICSFVCPTKRTKSQTSKSRNSNLASYALLLLLSFRVITAIAEHEGVSSQGESLECITRRCPAHIITTCMA